MLDMGADSCYNQNSSGRIRTRLCSYDAHPHIRCRRTGGRMEKMMMKTRLTAIILAALMLMMTVSACGTKQPSAADTDPAATTTAATDAAVTEVTTDANLDANGYWKDDLAADLDLGGEEITILYDDSSYAQEFIAEELSGDLINDAIHNRNLAVSDRLHVTLNFVGSDGRNETAAFIASVNSDVSSGAGEYDLIGTYSQIPGSLAMSGSLVDLMTLDHLNFDQPWWPQTLYEQASIQDHLYLCTGDISTNLLWMMQVVFFNKDLIARYDLEDPYTLIDDMKWTVDKMIEMTTGIYEDLNGNGVADEADHYGMVLYTQALDANFASAGLVCVDKDENGFFRVSPKMTSEKTVDLLTKFCEWVHDSGNVVWSKSTSVRKVMHEGRSLFIEDRAFVAKDHLVNQDAFEYGILPAPAYDEEQEGYITNVGYPHNIYCISSGISHEQANKAAAVLECMASESYRQVTPALFETTMKVKYAADEKTSEVYDMIKTNIDFDPARIYVKDFGGDLASLFKNSVIDNTTAWASRVTAVVRVAEKKCTLINETLGK